MAHEIAGICTCRLCGKTLTGPTALVVGTGLSHDNARVAQFSMKLAEHVMKEHPKENQALELKALEFLGMLRLANFETKDKGLIEQRDFLRWRTNQATIGATLSDEKIEQSAKEFAGNLVDMCEASLIIVGPGAEPPAHVEKVTAPLKAQATALLIEVIADMRELLQEPGKFRIEETAGVQPRNKVVLN